MKLSVVIPAHNEVDSVGETVERTVAEPMQAGIEHEILVLDDASGDGTGELVHSRARRLPGIRLLFRHGYNDTTNAFKAYRRYVIDQSQPLLANHFNVTVELPLKAIVHGYNFCVLPITRTNRRHGESKPKLQEMGSRYLFITFYLWLEHHLSRGDYRRSDPPAAVSTEGAAGRVPSTRA